MLGVARHGASPPPGLSWRRAEPSAAGRIAWGRRVHAGKHLASRPRGSRGLLRCVRQPIQARRAHRRAAAVRVPAGGDGSPGGDRGGVSDGPTEGGAPRHCLRGADAEGDHPASLCRARRRLARHAGGRGGRASEWRGPPAANRPGRPPPDARRAAGQGPLLRPEPRRAAHRGRDPLDPNPNVAASKTLPLGGTVRVTDLGNGRATTVRVEDRGPWGRTRESRPCPGLVARSPPRMLRSAETTPTEGPSVPAAPPCYMDTLSR